MRAITEKARIEIEVAIATFEKLAKHLGMKYKVRVCSEERDVYEVGYVFRPKGTWMTKEQRKANTQWTMVYMLMPTELARRVEVCGGKRFVKYMGYSITVMYDRPSYHRDEPPETEEIALGDAPNLMKALMKVIELDVQNQIAQAQENASYEVLSKTEELPEGK